MKIYSKVPIKNILKYIYQISEAFVFWYEKYIVAPDVAVIIQSYIDEIKNQTDVQADYEEWLNKQELLGLDLDEQE